MLGGLGGSRAFENRSKSLPRSVQSGILFYMPLKIDFPWIVDGFWYGLGKGFGSVLGMVSELYIRRAKVSKTIKFGDGFTFFIDFSYLALCIFKSKINQNRANILIKTTLQIIPPLGWILEPTCLHFGRVLGGKLEPKSLQIVSQIDVQKEQKKDHIFDGSGDRF